MQHHQAIESILFFKGESVPLSLLSSALEIEQDEVEQALEILAHDLQSRGIRLVRHHDAVELATAPEMHEIIKGLVKRDLTRKLGRAGMETLTIILYRGPITRRDIDFIRGVNSSSIIRNLLVRGLITKRETEENTRSVVYEPSTQLLRHLGITHVGELPEFETVQRELDQFDEETA